MTETSDKLVRLGEIESSLSQIQTIDEAKGIRDQAEALRVYAKSVRKGLSIQNRAARIKILAERRAGQLISEVPRATHRKNGQKGIRSMLERIEIPISTAHNWQAIALVPEEKIAEMEAQSTQSGGELTSASVISFARQERKKNDTPPKLVTPSNPEGPFRSIVIDPPWPVEKIILERRPVEREAMDYPTMTLEAIADLPVAKLADPSGCHIYLWVTHKFLPYGLELFSKWGVRYECVLTWNKPTAQPLWWRFLTEHCLFGKVGSLAPLKKGCAVSFSAPQQKHSHKPEEFFELARTVSPEPRLTMFDYERAGFQNWGITH